MRGTLSPPLHRVTALPTASPIEQGPQCLQETLFDLRIQSKRKHGLPVCSPKLALVGATAIDGKFGLPARVVEVQLGAYPMVSFSIFHTPFSAINAIEAGAV